jgi:magnesium transporter
VGTLIGAALGALAMPLVYFGFGDARLALAVGISIWVASSIAATLGLLLPWILAKVHVDPAHGSGPLATVIQDILSIVAYFLVLPLFGV